MIAAICARAATLDLGRRFGVSDSDAQILYFAGSLLLAVVLAAITWFYALQNKRMVEEMRRQSRPYVYLVCNGGRLVLKNSGTRSAHWIRIRVLHDADLQEGEFRQEGDRKILGMARLSTNVVVKEGVRALIPGAEQDIGQLARPALARPARVEYVVSYQDGVGTKYNEQLAEEYRV